MTMLNVLRFQKRRFTLFLFVLLLCEVTVWSQNGQENSSARFLVISDWGGFASDNQKAVAAAMAQEADRIKAQFILTAGDNYHGDGILTATDPRWKIEFEDVYNQKSLQIPWYPSLGNHDNRGNVDAEIEYSRFSQRWKLPARYYAREERIDDSTSILIVHMDTSPFIREYHKKTKKYHVEGQDVTKQLLWVDSVLTVSQSPWTIVLGHHPIYSAAPGHSDTKELINQVLPILTRHHVQLYICGHDHVLQHLKHDTMNFIICGGR